jgi:hypothetical protein
LTLRSPVQHIFPHKGTRGKRQRKNPSKVIQKISWEDYQDENPAQAKAVINAHPPPINNRDLTKYAQTNYYSQRERFMKWLHTGSGNWLYIHLFPTSSFKSNLSLSLSSSFTGYQKKFSKKMNWLNLAWVTANAIIKVVAIPQI